MRRNAKTLAGVHTSILENRKKQATIKNSSFINNIKIKDSDITSVPIIDTG